MNNQLFEAVKNNDLEMVKYLVSLGADIRSRDDFAVILASGNGHIHILKWFMVLLLFF